MKSGDKEDTNELPPRFATAAAFLCFIRHKAAYGVSLEIPEYQVDFGALGK